MLDDIERRRLLVEPAGEDPFEIPLGIADVELDEGASELLFFPGRGGVAGAQADDHVADAEGLARLHRQVAFDTITLVEQADDGDTLRHRRGPGNGGNLGLGNIDRDGLGLGLADLLGRQGRPVAPGEQQNGRADHHPASRHGAHQSGVHAW
jgi:hypothetical protein